MSIITTFPPKVPLPVGASGSYLLHSSLDQPSQYPTRHLDWFSRVRKAHERYQHRQTDRHTDHAIPCPSTKSLSLRCGLIIVFKNYMLDGTSWFIKTLR